MALFDLTIKVCKMSWSKFRKRFEAKYRRVCDMNYSLIVPYTNKGIDTIKEYSNKFNHLARYAPR